MKQVINENLTIIDGSEKYYDVVQKLCDDRFGPGLIVRADYDHWMEHPEMFRIALVDGEFAGYATAFPADDNELVRRLHMTVEEIHNLAGDTPRMFYHNTVVRPEYERRGIGMTLFFSVQEAAIKAGYRAQFCSAWVHDGKVHVGTAMERLGLKPVCVCEKLWYGNENYYCVVCKGRCVCDAMIYFGKA